MKPVVTLSAKGPDGKTWEVNVCPSCRRTCVNRELAEQCCMPTICRCGEPAEKPWTVCGGCRAESDRVRELCALGNAKKVSWREYDGPVYDQTSGEYHGSIDELVDLYETNYNQIPKYVYACTMHGITLDAWSIIESALDEHHEDAADQVIDVAGLQSALDAWCAKQTVESWEQDLGTVVLLDGLLYDAKAVHG